MRLKSNLRTVTSRMCLLVMLMMLSTVMAMAQGVTLKGTVVDEFDEPLIGAKVAEVGVANGVITDLDGNFQLKVSDGVKSVQVSYIGYKTQTFQIPTSGILNVKLEPTVALDAFK